jgi:hypothetical protein
MHLITLLNSLGKKHIGKSEYVCYNKRKLNFVKYHIQDFIGTSIFMK